MKSKKKETEEAERDNAVTVHDPAKKYTGWNPIKRMKMKSQADKRYHILMHLRNGDRAQFYVFTDKPHFLYKGGRYILNSSEHTFDTSAGCYSLTYFQDFSVPVKFGLDIAKARNAAKTSKITDLDIAFNPFSLEDFGRSKVVEGAMQGQGLAEWLRQIKTILIVIGIVAAGHLLLFVWKSGMLQAVKTPWGG